MFARAVCQLFNGSVPGVHRVGWAVWVPAVLALAAPCAAASTTQMVEGIRQPLQRHPNGRVQVLLTARQAWITETAGEVEGGIRVYVMTESGMTNGVAEAVRGRFDLGADAQTASCQGPVSFVMDGIRLSGTNLNWSAEATCVTIETNAVLVLERDGRSMVEGVGL